MMPLGKLHEQTEPSAYADHAGRPWPANPAADRTGPLAGLRVADFSRILAGPFATMQLADLGADVIKVESPVHGDETRRWGPPFGDDGSASYFHAVNHSKRSIALDLRDAEDSRIARELASCADVVVDNFLPGRMREFGLDRASLAIENPRVITATISGFGTGNVYSDRPGFDFLAQAMGGLMSITGQPDGEPTRVGVAVTDILAGSLLCSGVLAALVGTRAGQPGRHVEVSLLDAQISMLANVASGWLIGETAPRRFGNAHPSIAPYETFPTSDAVIAVAVGTDRQFRRLCAAIGRAGLAQDERFTTNALRIRNRDPLTESLADTFATASCDHWVDALTDADVPVARVNTVRQALEDPVVRERMIAHVDGVAQIRTPIRLDGEALPVSSRPPRHGEHTDDVRERLSLPTRGR